MTCRILPFETALGPANMALDQALLEEVARGEQPAYLRFYGWSIPTLSLGYFQRISDVHADPRWRSVPLVRRPTGGGAIWHENDLTYAIVVPASIPHARPRDALYRAVHAAIASALVELGLPADRRGDVSRNEPAARKRPLLCFTDPNPDDIVSHGFKLVGSAQRRRGGAILQHGSVLLARSARVPELPGVCDVADVSRSPHGWLGRLALRIPAALGFAAEHSTVPEAARARARELERTVYRSVAWTEGRSRFELSLS
jgi:lipoate-protein ligase A